jgi:hypothetical protein
VQARQTGLSGQDRRIILLNLIGRADETVRGSWILMSFSSGIGDSTGPTEAGSFLPGRCLGHVVASQVAVDERGLTPDVVRLVHTGPCGVRMLGGYATDVVTDWLAIAVADLHNLVG